MLAAAARPDDSTPVLYLNLYAEIGGAENALLELLAGLDRARFPPIVAVASDGPLVARLREAGVECRVVPFPARSLWNLALPWVLGRAVGAARTLRALAAERGVRVLHTGDVLGLLLGLALGARVRVLYQANYSGGAARRVLLRWLARRVSRIVVFSEAQKRDLARTAPELLGRCEIVPVGIEPPRPSASRAQVREELAVAPEVPFVAMFARFDAMKGHDTFLRAAGALRRQRPDAAFAIVGGALNARVLPHVARVRARVVALRRELGLEAAVRLSGFVPDAAGVMVSCDVVVCPSLNEPFGLVVVEAMALGIAVVVSDSGGPAEIVEDGVSGLHFRTGDPASLAAAVERLLADVALRRRLAEAGRLRASMRYDRPHYIRAMETLYASLA
jgi:glycosyltransferase involved in cell wall biosynthesis